MGLNCLHDFAVFVGIIGLSIEKCDIFYEVKGGNIGQIIAGNYRKPNAAALLVDPVAKTSRLTGEIETK